MNAFAQGLVLVVAIAIVAGILAVGAVLARVAVGPDPDLDGRWDPRTEWAFRARSRERAAVAVAIGVLLTLFLLAAVAPGPLPR